MVFARFARLARIIDLMNRPGGVTIRQMMDELEIQERSVYRALQGLELLNVDFFKEPVPGAPCMRYRLAPDYAAKLPTFSLPHFDLNFSELMALCLACADSGPMRGTGLEKALKTAFNKFSAQLPVELVECMDGLSEVFVALPEREKMLDGKEELIESLVNAILNHRCCRMRYYSFHSREEKTYLLEPLHFFEHQGGLYLFANIPAYDDVRMLAVQRMLEVEVLAEKFQYPKSFDVHAKLREPFGLIINDPLTVTVRLSPNASRYALEQRFFVSQEKTCHPDGSIATTITTSGRRDVLSWVLGSMGEVEILAPEDLREEVCRLGSEVAGIHGRNHRKD